MYYSTRCALNDYSRFTIHNSREYQFRHLFAHARRAARVASPFLLDGQALQIFARGDAPESALAHEFVVNGGWASGINRRRRDAERGGLAVHRAARADDEVCGGDEVRAVERRARRDKVIRAEARRQTRALSVAACEQHELDARAREQAREQLFKQLVLETVIQGFARGRADDDERVALCVNAELLSKARGEPRVGREVCEVNVLLDALVAANLRGARAESPERVCGERAGDDDARREPEGEVVRRLVLVVHQSHRANSEEARRQNLRVRVVADGQIETATARPAHEPRGAPEETAGLARELPAAVTAHDRGREPR